MGRLAAETFELVQVVQYLRMDARLLEIARSVGILGVDEGARLGALGVFKPAITVWDFGAKIIVGHGNGIDNRRGRQGDAFAAMNDLG